MSGDRVYQDFDFQSCGAASVRCKLKAPVALNDDKGLRVDRIGAPGYRRFPKGAVVIDLRKKRVRFNCQTKILAFGEVATFRFKILSLTRVLKDSLCTS